MKKIPNAIIVGAGKAGSTSLYRYLDMHPRIFGSRVKELMYFSSKFSEGPEWYRSHFPVQSQIDIYFEATPQYTFRDEFPNVAARIFEYNPDIKILYIVREPLARIVSHFNHWARAFPDKYKDIEETLSDPLQWKYFVDRSKYFYQMEAYLEFFDPSQIKLVFLEDLNSTFVETMNDVYGFLGVDECAETVDNKVFNQGRKAKDIRSWKLVDISEARRAEICCALSRDVRQLLSYADKPADFWGEAYT